MCAAVKKQKPVLFSVLLAGLLLVMAVGLFLACRTGQAAAITNRSGEELPASLSYLTDTYIPRMENALSEKVRSRTSGGTDTSPGKGESGPALYLLGDGNSLNLHAGQSVIMVQGEAAMQVDTGTAVDCTLGVEFVSGMLKQGHRYVICENSEAYLLSYAVTDLILSGEQRINPRSERVSPFLDVREGSWYYDDVVSAWEWGLVNGMSRINYEPTGRLTVAQCVKLAACMHQKRNLGMVSLQNSGTGHWYDSYVSYAVEYGILSREPETYDFDSAIDRRGFVELFYRALPESDYLEINGIDDDAIPDVSIYDEGASEIYAFYRAGILTGYTQSAVYAEHAFGPDSDISRAEAAVIMNRMFDRNARVSFQIDK